MSIEDELERLEHQIGRILRAGVFVVAAVLVVGLALDAVGIAAASTLLAVGLVCLMFVPASRVVASFVDAIRRRDALLAWSTGIVIAILIGQWVWQTWIKGKL